MRCRPPPLDAVPLLNSALQRTQEARNGFLLHSTSRSAVSTPITRAFTKATRRPRCAALLQPLLWPAAEALVRFSQLRSHALQGTPFTSSMATPMQPRSQYIADFGHDTALGLAGSGFGLDAMSEQARACALTSFLSSLQRHGP